MTDVLWELKVLKIRFISGAEYPFKMPDYDRKTSALLFRLHNFSIFNHPHLVLQKDRYPELDALRGIAAMMVVFFHLSMYTPASDFGLKLGYMGPELFLSSVALLFS